MILKANSYSCIKFLENGGNIVCRSSSWSSNESKVYFSKIKYMYSLHWTRDTSNSLLFGAFRAHSWSGNV